MTKFNFDKASAYVKCPAVTKKQVDKELMMKPITVWAGFVNGKMQIFEDNVFMQYGRLYKTKKSARQFYQDVRKVKIVEEK